MKCLIKLFGLFFLCMVLLWPNISEAKAKKGLLVYTSVYGSTIEVAYWIKAIIGHEQHLDVKTIDQVLTITPYDYVIIGSLTRDEKPKEVIYEFIEKNRAELTKKEVCYFLTCGDSDETMVLKVPGKDAHLIGGRNYLLDLMDKFPDIKPVAIAGFGGRQVLPNMKTMDSIQVWIVGKLAKEGASWKGFDIWESLVPTRVEAFANEVRVKVLGLTPRENVEQFRGYWESLQPANLTNPKLIKFTSKPYDEHRNTEKIYFARSHIKGNLNLGMSLLQTWAKQNNIDLRQQVKSSFNVYYHAVKKYGDEEITTHLVIATFPDDPGNLHVSFRCWEKPDNRKGVEEDITKAENILWADGRKIE